MQARPFRLLGESALLAVQRTLARAAESWAAQWGAAAPTVTVVRAWDGAAAADAFASAASDHGRSVYLACDPALPGAVESVLFGAPRQHGGAPLAQAGARAALDGLLDSLARSALASQANPARSACGGAPAAAFAHASGAVLASVAIGRLHCQLLLDAAAVQALQPLPPTLPALGGVNLAASVASAPVALQLTIGAARVGLGSLMALAVGDVIRLDTQVDAPVALSGPDGTALFSAYLGRSGDSLAVEVLARQSISHGVVS